MRVTLNELRKMILQEARAIGPRKETNKELFKRYATTFGFTVKPGLPGGQWLIIDEDNDIAGHMETTDGAFTKGPVFWLRQFREDQWSGNLEDPYVMSSDDAEAQFTRADLEQAILEQRPLHDTQPDRRTKNKI